MTRGCVARIQLFPKVKKVIAWNGFAYVLIVAIFAFKQKI